MQAVNIPDDAHYLLKSIHEHLKLPGLTPISPLFKTLAKLAVSGPTEPKSVWDKLGDSVAQAAS